MTDPRSGFEDYLSRHYRHLGDQARHRARKKRQLLATYRFALPTDRDAEMLEIGPGYGQLLELLRRDLGYVRTTAIDLSEEVAEFCNRALPGSTERVTDTVAYLEAHGGRFERVFALHVLEHVPRAEAPGLARAIRGALRPGGRVVLEVPNLANLLTGSYLRYADLTHEWGYAESSLRHLLEAAGFVDVECFEERRPADEIKGLLAGAFRGGARWLQRAIYRGYELPVPDVLTPALCAVASRPPEAS